MNKDIKPIVVIYIPYDIELGNGERMTPAWLMQLLNTFPEADPKAKIKASELWKDYLWLSFFKNDIREPELKVFYPKDFTEIQYQELKDMLSEAIKTLTN